MSIHQKYVVRGGIVHCWLFNHGSTAGEKRAHDSDIFNYRTTKEGERKGEEVGRTYRPRIDFEPTYNTDLLLSLGQFYKVFETWHWIRCLF
jgi:hypothetical protein